MQPEKPTPKLNIGDVILWRGWRGMGRTTDYVFDHVSEVIVEYKPESIPPRWHIYYRTEKQYGFAEDQLAPPVRTGHLNVAGRMGNPSLHNDRLEVALRQRPEGFDEAVRWLIDAGWPVHPRMQVLYPQFRALHYARTWGSVPTTITMRTRCLTLEQAHILQFVSTEPTDDQILTLVGGGGEWHWKEGQRKPFPDLDRAFEYNRYEEWAGVADFNLDSALRLLAQASNEEIVDRMRQYRRDLLAGRASFVQAKTLEWLFPLNESKASGAWPDSVRAWARQQGIKGAGKTRLRRVYEAVTKSGEETMLEPSDYLRIWPDKKVLAIVAGKGGVGKSTVAADLARSLARSGRRVFLADLDMHGPSQHKFFPLPDEGIKTEAGLMVPPQVDGVDVMSFGYLVDGDEAVTHRGPFLASLIHLASLYTKVEADIVILDMPPGTGDVLRHVQEICPTAYYMVVATASTVATPDVQRAIAALNTDNKQRIVGVVDNMAYLAGPNGSRQPRWGSLEDVPDLARRNNLRYLGALPFFPWSETGSEEARITATAETLLPALEQHVLATDIPYQDVTDFEALVEEAVDWLKKRMEDARFGSIRAVWGLDNIAGFLAAPIVKRGGNPDDPQYREVLLQALRRVWAYGGNEVLTHTRSESLDESSWWHQAALDALAAKAEAG